MPILHFQDPTVGTPPPSPPPPQDDEVVSIVNGTLLRERQVLWNHVTSHTNSIPVADQVARRLNPDQPLTPPPPFTSVDEEVFEASFKHPGGTNEQIFLSQWDNLRYHLYFLRYRNIALDDERHGNMQFVPLDVRRGNISKGYTLQEALDAFIEALSFEPGLANLTAAPECAFLAITMPYHWLDPLWFVDYFCNTEGIPQAIEWLKVNWPQSGASFASTVATWALSHMKPVPRFCVFLSSELTWTQVWHLVKNMTFLQWSRVAFWFPTLRQITTFPKFEDFFLDWESHPEQTFQDVMDKNSREVICTELCASPIKEDFTRFPTPAMITAVLPSFEKILHQPCGHRDLTEAPTTENSFSKGKCGLCVLDSLVHCNADGTGYMPPLTVVREQAMVDDRAVYWDTVEGVENTFLGELVSDFSIEILNHPPSDEEDEDNWTRQNDERLMRCYDALFRYLHWAKKLLFISNTRKVFLEYCESKMTQMFTQVGILGRTSPPNTVSPLPSKAWKLIRAECPSPHFVVPINWFTAFERVHRDIMTVSFSLFNHNMDEFEQFMQWLREARDWMWLSGVQRFMIFLSQTRQSRTYDQAKTLVKVVYNHSRLINRPFMEIDDLTLLRHCAVIYRAKVIDMPYGIAAVIEGCVPHSAASARFRGNLTAPDEYDSDASTATSISVAFPDPPTMEVIDAEYHAPLTTGRLIGHAREAGPGMLGLYNEVMAAVETFISTTKHDWKNIAPVATCVATLGLSLYNLISEIMREDRSNSIVISNAIILASNAVSLCALLVNTFTTKIHDWFVSSMVRAFFPFIHEEEPQFSEKAPAAIVKCLSVLSVGVARCCGFKAPIDVLNSVGNAFRAADATTEAVSELLVDVFDVDIDGRKAESDLIKALETTGEKFLSDSSVKWSGSYLMDVRTWLASANDLLRKPNAKGRFRTGRLSTLVVDVSKRLCETVKIMESSVNRPVPYALWIWGEPALGKTEFVNQWLIPHLAVKFNVSPQIYNLDSGKFSLPIQNKRWAVYDEAGARILQPGTEDIIVRLNALLSGSPCSMPGAALEDKCQVATFNGVVFISNMHPAEVDFGVMDEAHRAFLTRLEIFEVLDPRFDPAIGRFNQPHRRPDFGHLRFHANQEHVAMDMDVVQNAVFGAEVLLNRCVTQIVRLSNRFYGARAQNVEEEILDAVVNGEFVLPDPLDYMRFAVEAEQPQASTPFTISLFGPSGSRKTTEYIPAIAAQFASLGFESIFAKPDEQQLATIDKVLWIFDDTYDFSSQEAAQAFLVKFNTSVRPQDAALVVSNYGPAHGYMAKVHRKFKWVPVDLTKVPGVARRLGWDRNRPEALAIYTMTDSTAHHFWESKPFSPSAVLQGYMQHHLGTDFLRYETEMPQQLPFSRDEADAWWVSTEIPPENPSYLYLYRNLSMSLRGSVYFTNHCSSILGDKNWFEALQRMLMCNLCASVPDAKIYISLPMKTFMVYNGVFYAGDVKRQLMIQPDTTTGTFYVVNNLAPREAGVEITHRHYREFAVNELPVSSKLGDVQVYQALAQARTHQVDIFEQIQTSPRYALVPADLSTIQQRLARRKKGSSFVWLKEHWKLFLGVSALTLTAGLVAIKLWKHITKKSELPKGPSVGSYCEFCASEDYCPNKDWTVEENAKGKNKSGTRKAITGFGSGGLKKLMFNGRVYYEDDWEGDTFLDQIVHNTNKRIREGAYRFDNDYFYIDDIQCSYGTINGVMPRAGGLMSFVPAKWNEEAAPNSGDETIDKVAGNIFTYDQDRRWCGFLITPRLAVTSAHCISQGQILYDCIYHGIPVTMKLLKHDQIHEIAFLVPVDRNERPVGCPGAHDLSSLILERPFIPNSGFSTLVTKEHQKLHHSTFTGRFMIQSIPHPRFDHKAFSNWGLDAGLTFWGSANCPSKVGHSGSPVLLNTKKGYVLLGVHAGCRSATKHLLFGVLSENLIKETLMNDTPHVATTSEQDEVEHVLPIQFAGCLNPDGKPTFVVSAPAVNLGVVRNSLPMDTKNEKVPIGFAPLDAIFGNLKSPALPIDEVLEKFSDKIPPDAGGGCHPANIKMFRLQEEKPHDENKLARLVEAAIVLSGYYKQKSGSEKLQPLSVFQALNGTSPGTKIPTDTSTGAAFQLLHPEAPTKGHLLTTNEDGSVTFADNPAAHTAKQMIERQWDHAGKFQYESLPASTSFKSELLPNEKVWRKRIVNVVDIATVINQKRILAPVMDLLTADGACSDFQLKTNPFKDWDVIAQKLNSKNSQGVASLDFKDFDWTVPEEAFIALAHFVAAFYDDGESPVLIRRILTLLHGIALQPVLVGKDLIGKTHGMLSGIYGTSLCDSIITKILLYEVYSTAKGYIEGLIPVEEFMASVETVGCGDDTTISVLPSDTKDFTLEVLKKEVKISYGMNVTTSDKQDSVASYGKLAEASFCSRGFVPLPNHPSHWCSRLKAEAMSGILCWTSYHNPTDIVGQLESMRPEFVGWGKHKYEEFERALRGYCLVHGVEYLPVTWKTLIEGAWEALSAAPMPSVIKFEEPEPVSHKKQIRALIEEALGSKNFPETHPKDMDCAGISKRRVLKHLRHVIQDVESLSEFRNTRFARTLGSAPNKDKLTFLTRNIPYTRETYYAPAKYLTGFIQSMANEEEEEEIVEKMNSTAVKNHPSLVNAAFKQFDKDRKLCGFYTLLRKDPDNSELWKMFTDFFIGMESQSTPGASSIATPLHEKQGSSVDSAAPQRAVLSGDGALGGTLAPGANISAATVADGVPMAPEMSTGGGLAPPILVAAAGVDGSLVPQRGWWRDAASYTDPYYIETLLMSSSTQSGYIIKQWDFNPWDPNLVGPFAYWYTSAHDAFIGRILLKVDINVSAAVFGQIAVFMIPGTQVGRVKTTIKDMWQFPHAIFNLSQNTSWMIEMAASQEEGFCVKREELGEKVFCRCIMMTYTPINSNYGAALSIPLVISGGLAPGSTCSDFRGSSGYGTSDFDLDPAQTDGTFVLDGIYPARPMETAALPENVEWLEPFTPRNATGQLKLNGLYAGINGFNVPGSSSSSGDFVNQEVEIPTISLYSGLIVTEQLRKVEGTFVSDPDAIIGHVVCSPGVIPPVGNPADATSGPIWTCTGNGETYSSLVGSLEFENPCIAMYRQTAADGTLVEGPLLGMSGSVVLRTDNTSRSITRFSKQDGTILTQDGILRPNVSAVTTTDSGKFSMPGGTSQPPGLNREVIFQSRRATTRKLSTRGAIGAAWLDTDPVCIGGETVSRPATIPSGYVQVSYVLASTIVPSVQPLVQGHTLMEDGVGLTMKVNDMQMIANSKFFKAIVTIFTGNTGTNNIAILRNRYGWWVYGKEIQYATFKTAFEGLQQSHATYSQEWPSLPLLNPEEVTTRKNSPNPAPPVLSRTRQGLGTSQRLRLSRHCEPQCAMIAAGVLGGVGQGIASGLQWKQQQDNFEQQLAQQQKQFDTGIGNTRWLQTNNQSFQTGYQTRGFGQERLMQQRGFAQQTAMQNQKYNLETQLMFSRLGLVGASNNAPRMAVVGANGVGMFSTPTQTKPASSAGVQAGDGMVHDAGPPIQKISGADLKIVAPTFSQGTQPTEVASTSSYGGESYA